MTELKINRVSKLEVKLQIIFYNAKTLNGARAGLMSLDKLERQAETIEDSDTIKDCIDFLFVRGNMMIAEGRA